MSKLSLAPLLAIGMASSAAAGPALAELGAARANVQSNTLTVTTGVMEREWQWTGKGLVTIGIRDLRSGKQWAIKPSRAADWDLPGLLGDNTPGVLVSTEARL